MIGLGNSISTRALIDMKGIRRKGTGMGRDVANATPDALCKGTTTYLSFSKLTCSACYCNRTSPPWFQISCQGKLTTFEWLSQGLR